MNRKSFIQQSARLLLLGTFAGGTAHLATRKRISAKGNCDHNNQCKGCGRISACSLPQALNQKDHGK